MQSIFEGARSEEIPLNLCNEMSQLLIERGEVCQRLGYTNYS